ncbi:hypothetical protein HHI36_011057, partial [Cryptolaemus montrouzieri]
MTNKEYGKKMKQEVYEFEGCNGWTAKRRQNRIKKKTEILEWLSQVIICVEDNIGDFENEI